MRWSVRFREARPFRPLTIALTLDGSVSSLTLKSTTCSTMGWAAAAEDMLILGVKRECEGLEKRRRVSLGAEKVREN